jgi:cation diffusion facilitator CzcD-associated flavoprotein CzcO
LSEYHVKAIVGILAFMSSPVQVAIAGAGPYGLSVATHLRRSNVSFRIFGHPMRFWLEMPDGMFLKSLGFATTIANPDQLTFDAWCREKKIEDREPCSMESFAEYGVWLQKKLVPEVEQKDVTLIERQSGGFRMTTSTGERVDAQRVVVAVGLRYYLRIPRGLAGLPAEVMSHTSQNKSYEKFRGKDVCVIGAGQSALEAAVLLHEAGARPQLLVRTDGPVFHDRTPDERSIIDRLKAPITVLGASRTSWVLEHLPWAMRLVPEAKRVRFTKRYLGPAGSWWLRPRFEGKVHVRGNCEVTSSRMEGGKVVLGIKEKGSQGEIRTDAVVAGTGYELNIDKLPFLSSGLRSEIARIEGGPKLDRHFQTSVSGLYFVGISSMYSFGPLVRFVAGTPYTAPIVASHLARKVVPVPLAQLALESS